MKLSYDYEDRKGDYGKCGCDRKDYDKKERKDYDYHDREKCCEDHKYAKCYPKNPCPYPILFECAMGTGANIERSDVTSGKFVDRSLGCVTIDTSCLKMPVVKFDFNTTISYRVISSGSSSNPARIVFALFKKCDDGHEVMCGTWDFKINLDTNLERLTTSYSFSHCEMNSCPGCCTYSVRIIEADTKDADNTLEVGCSTLSVIAKSAC